MITCSSSCGPAPSIVFLFPAIIFGIFFVYAFCINKRNKDALKNLTGVLKGGISKSFFLNAFEGQYEGLPLQISLTPGSKNTPPYLRISLAKESTFKLTIYKENVLSSFGEKLGLVHEVKVNDEAFDKEFLIFSNDANRVMSYLAGSIDKKNVIRELFNHRFNALIIDGKKILIQMPNYNVNYDLQSLQVTTALQKLNILAKGLM
ncbi:MAG: hypothetical protein WC695_02915 [Candidatus Omnitrophota bacterium]